jgi:hypothetical protein
MPQNGWLLTVTVVDQLQLIFSETTIEGHGFHIFIACVVHVFMSLSFHHAEECSQFYYYSSKL